MRLLAAGAAATVVVGFVVGFALGGQSSGPATDVTASGPVPSSTTTSTSTTTEAPATSTTLEAVTTTSSPVAPSSVSSTTAAVTTTEAPPTTAVVPFPTIPTTLALPTTTGPTYAPPRVVVTYSVDASGRLPIPRSGSATLVIANEGGLAQQWLVTGSGFTVIGPAQGSLGAGQSIAVSLAAPPGELPTGEISGIVSVLGAVNPTIAYVIPRA